MLKSGRNGYSRKLALVQKKGKLKALDLHKDEKWSTVPLNVTVERRTERSVFP